MPRLFLQMRDREEAAGWFTCPLREAEEKLMDSLGQRIAEEEYSEDYTKSTSET